MHVLFPETYIRFYQSCCQLSENVIDGPIFHIFAFSMTTKEKILNIIKAHKSELSRFGIHEIGLFGSYVRGEQSPESDIDILIDFEPNKESYDNLMATYDYIESIFSNEKIEIVTKNSLSPYLGPKILNEVVYV